MICLLEWKADAKKRVDVFLRRKYECRLFGKREKWREGKIREKKYVGPPFLISSSLHMWRKFHTFFR